MGVEVDDPRAAERVGAFLADKWTLERLLGSGGMGAVYAARHRNGARAALKILHPDLSRVPEVRDRFLREGYAANRVEHRGAVKVLDDDFVKEGPDAGSAYLVMELLDGESLEARSQRPPPVREVEMLEIMDAVLDVLVAAHDHGVVHRDLKPENLFLATDPDGGPMRVKVLDFGLARINEVASQTSAGLALGTPSFMSPEQAAGKADEIDGQTDIFALGATAFRVTTGRRIHEAENVVQLVVKMATIPAPPFRDVMPELSEHFARVIDKALAFEKAERYPTAEAMRADVRAALKALRGSKADDTHVAPYSDRAIPVAGVAPVAVRKKSSPTLPHIEEREPETPLESARETERSESVAYDPSPPSRLPILLLFAAIVSFVAFMFGDQLQTKLEQLAQPFGFTKTPPGGASPSGSGAAGSGLPPAPTNATSVTSGELRDGGAMANAEGDAGAGAESDASASSLAAMFNQMVDDIEHIIDPSADDAGALEPGPSSAGATGAPPSPNAGAATAHKPAPPPAHPPTPPQHKPPPPPPKRPPYHPPPHRPPPRKR
jgi:serine/threonine-protein kinase